jgi:enamine deaminase RidA (YjgF/YER057c/UK114 family)
MADVIQPEGWRRPSGYAPGMVGRGRVLAVSGQLGTGRDGVLVSGGLVAQFDQALENVAAVISAAGGRIEDTLSMTVYVVDRAAYLEAREALGVVWGRRAGRHYPAMTLVEVKGLVEAGAVVELQALAVLP